MDNSLEPVEKPVKPKRRWFYPTPGCLFIGLLVVEAILLLTEHWFPKGWSVLFAIASVGVTMIVMLLWLVLALLFRWRFQFSLRSLFLLTVMIAIPASWLAVEMKWAREQRDAVAALLKDGSVIYDNELDSDNGWIPESEFRQPAPVWLQHLLGDDFFRTAIKLEPLIGELTPNDLEHLKRLS